LLASLVICCYCLSPLLGHGLQKDGGGIYLTLITAIAPVSSTFLVCIRFSINICWTNKLWH
jgi:hypothetical protein